MTRAHRQPLLWVLWLCAFALGSAAAQPEIHNPADQPRSADEAALKEPRQIAAAVIGADGYSPRSIVQVGAHHGEFLEVFLERFPAARGLWTEPNNSEQNLPAAKARLARFGDRVDYHYGCADRDISDGCVPGNTDVILTDWVSILQDLAGMRKIYRLAAAQLAPGGWLVNIDRAGFADPDWARRIEAARAGIRPAHEAPPVHHPEYRTPTSDEQLQAMRAAGLDAKVLWQSLNTVLIMARKPL